MAHGGRAKITDKQPTSTAQAESEIQRLRNSQNNLYTKGIIPGPFGGATAAQRKFFALSENRIQTLNNYLRECQRHEDAKREQERAQWSTQRKLKARRS
jgi:hypothetical protein